MITVIVGRLAEVDMYWIPNLPTRYSTTMMVLTAGRVVADNADVKLETLDTARASEVCLPLDVST